MSAAYPALLYKYLPPARADIFETGKLCFSHRRALNDPLEFHYSFDALSQAREAAKDARLNPDFDSLIQLLITTRPKYAELLAATPESDLPRVRAILTAHLLPIAKQVWEKKRSDPLDEELLRPIAEQYEAESKLEFTELFDRLFRIFSCTENGMCVPMWTHYTENHTGFQIAFDPVRLFNQPIESADDLMLKPVAYSDVAYVLSQDESFAFIHQKMADWAYEKEWRYVRTTPKSEQEAKLCLVDFEVDAIREVTFGLQATEETVMRISSAMAARGCTASLFRIAMGHSYRLEKTPLDLAGAST